MLVGWLVGRVTHLFDDPHVAPYWPTWPCSHWGRLFFSRPIHQDWNCICLRQCLCKMAWWCAASFVYEVNKHWMKTPARCRFRFKTNLFFFTLFYPLWVEGLSNCLLVLQKWSCTFFWWTNIFWICLFTENILKNTKQSPRVFQMKLTLDTS